MLLFERVIRDPSREESALISIIYLSLFVPSAVLFPDKWKLVVLQVQGWNFRERNVDGDFFPMYSNKK